MASFVRNFGVILFGFLSSTFSASAQPIVALRDEASVVVKTLSGTFSNDEKGTRLLTPHAFADAFLVVPSTSNRGNGVVQLDFRASKADDFSLLARVVEGKPFEKISAVALSVEPLSRGRHRMVLYRFVDGQVREMGPSTKLPIAPGQHWRLSLKLEGKQVFAKAHLVDGGPTVALFAIDDNLGPDGFGIRVTAKSQSTTFKNLRQRRETGKTTFQAKAAFGPQRLLSLSPSMKLSPELKAAVVEESKKRRLVLLSARRAYELFDARPSAQFRIAQTGDVPFKWLRHDVKQAYSQTKLQGFSFPSYRDSQQVERLLKDAHLRHPTFTELKSIGKSHQGNDLWAFVVDDKQDAKSERPTILLAGGHHGLELFASDVVLDALALLLDDRNELAQRIRQRFRVVIVPLVNPDGADSFIHRSTFSGRKNGRDTNNNGLWDASDGVDLNRNYPFGFASLGEKGSRSLEGHFRYRGPFASSEPETKALLALAAKETFLASLTVHTYATAILVPYTLPGLPLRPTRDDEGWRLALRMKRALKKQVNGRTFRVKRRLYPVDGTDQDHLFHFWGTTALLLEAPVHNPRPQKRQRALKDVRRGVEAFFSGLLAGPVLHISTSENGVPASLAYDVDKLPALLKEPWKTNAFGYVHRLLPAKTRKLKVRVFCSNGPILKRSVVVKAPQTDVAFSCP
ncbi:MAG: zinc carboxypeptidase [Deltaproteobacteria bacterium]|nr:zinc carboxypeptidase [Deltaproteobacteria bacterium]